MEIDSEIVYYCVSALVRLMPVEIGHEIVYYCVNTLAHLNGEFLCNWHGIVHGSVRQFLMDGILLLVAHFTGAGVLVY